MCSICHLLFILTFHPYASSLARGGVEVERWPRMREIGVRFPVAIDLSR